MLEIRDLDVSIHAVEILRGVELDLPDGEMAGLIGRNGAGKTTLMRTIMGLLGYRQGSIRFQGKDLKTVPTYAISRLGFGFMPEDRRLVPDLTVEENILVPAWAVGSPEMEKRLELVYWMIPEVKASADRKAMQLSGGQQKLVALGRALMSGTKLLLLDEPFEGVAPALSMRLVEVVSALKKEGISIILSESDLKHSSGMLDRVFRIDRGVVSRAMYRVNQGGFRAMIRKVAVIGAGVMGHGIAQLYALAGFPVSLHDVREELLDRAFRAMEDSLSLLEKEKFVTGAQKEEALRRVSRTTDLEEAVKEADFITEAIPEVLEMKWELFGTLERLAKPDAIIASNTSTLPISGMAKHSATPHRMIITHYFNPAQLVPLVEIVKHEKTTETVVETTTELMRKIGKHPVLLKKEVPGFIANRLQAAIVREAFHLLGEGVADARDIDAAITAGPGFRWAFIGPIETADFGGLDTWKRVIDNLAPLLDKRESAPERMAESVRAGNLGTKSGKGIYSYSDVSVPEKIRERDTNFIRLLKLKRDE